jgi:hypothetical protein
MAGTPKVIVLDNLKEGVLTPDVFESQPGVSAPAERLQRASVRALTPFRTRIKL